MAGEKIRTVSRASGHRSSVLLFGAALPKPKRGDVDVRAKENELRCGVNCLSGSEFSRAEYRFAW